MQKRGPRRRRLQAFDAQSTHVQHSSESGLDTLVGIDLAARAERAEALGGKRLEEYAQHVNHAREAVVVRFLHVRLDRPNEALVERRVGTTDGVAKRAELRRRNRQLELAVIERHRAQQALHRLGVGAHLLIRLVKNRLDARGDEGGQLPDTQLLVVVLLCITHLSEADEETLVDLLEVFGQKLWKLLGRHCAQLLNQLSELIVRQRSHLEHW